jgi:DNA-directed RNA polymerase subunit M/transcription elongation factor TFIIS
MDNKERKNQIKDLSKVVKKSVATKVEKSVHEFSKEYSIMNETPFLFENIYMTKMNELLEQLKSSKLLVKKLENKEIKYERLPYLTVEELHPEKYDMILKKKEIEEFKKNNKPSTNAFKCPRCKKKKALVEEKQTRRADESSTLFLECLECGNKWRIG